MMEQEVYDVIVVGGGHAGCEAAAAAANLGSRVLLVTMDMHKFGSMSCNPAVGGIAKGQIVREIDALGGYTALVTDMTSIQFRMLNKSKGPAMWSPRSQCDRELFPIAWRRLLESTPNLEFWQDTVTKLILEDGKAKGVVTSMGTRLHCKSLVLTNGTFLNGLMHVGRKQSSGGRASQPASFGLSEQLLAAGFETGRMKTGTPARLDGRSIDFSQLEEQAGDPKPGHFSFMPQTETLGVHRPCYIGYTSPQVHETLRLGFVDSPMFNGTIKSIGPRYCPSIEDKVVTFASKDKHQLFLEPEGRDTVEYYINGFSSSLPLEVQLEGLRKIRGLEKVRIFRPGYAIEYDFFQPTQLYHSLETKRIENLFFAGQINGTTGYEEAAAQGLMAGVNAHLKINGQEPFVLSRDEAYIGVLIDDLVTKGVDEPYRMFTSRAEYRILLRQDNADARLTEKSYRLGLASRERYERFLTKQAHVQALLNFADERSVKPEEVDPFLESLGSASLKHALRLRKLLLRPELDFAKLLALLPDLSALAEQFGDLREEVIEAAEVLIKYEGYIDREREIAAKLSRLEGVKIDPKIDYARLLSLSTEARQKLSNIRPQTIGQASRITGVSPSDINVLLVHMGR